MKRYAIIGAGAAGCFCAIELKRRCPSDVVEIFEAGRRPLAKVAVTGGGRCNLTNSFASVRSLEEIYPRGHHLMKRILREFGNRETMEWFEKEGVRLTVQDDGCVFPASQDAMQIVRTLTSLISDLGIKIHCNARIANAADLVRDFDAVVITTGGGTASIVDGLGIATEPQIPSLFTFNIAEKSLCSLMGTVVENASVSLTGTKMRASGPLLITDWGLSGPAILKLSSYGARYLAGCNYRSGISIRWADGFEPLDSHKMICSTPPDGLSSRLWKHIISRSGLREDIRWSEAGSRGINKLREAVLNDTYTITGKCRFKDEFVTCGGVSLDAVHPGTLRARSDGRFAFAGEVLDIDAITGGFNLQAAWSTGWVAAKGLAEAAEGQMDLE